MPNSRASQPKNSPSKRVTKPRPPKTRQDWDNPWKEIVQRLLPSLLQLLFLALYEAIDWNYPIQPRDKELRQLARGGKQGKKYVDALFEVKLKSGERAWIWIHLEIQGYVEARFASRFFLYHTRLRDMAGHPVVSMAILTDNDPNWRPSSYEYADFGCRLRFEFPMVKLLDYRERWSELEASDNPFALVMMAHLKAMETVGDVEGRYSWKWYLTQLLYEKGYSEQEREDLYWFLDWVMVMPIEEERRFDAELVAWEEEHKVRYVIGAERRAREDERKEILLHLMEVKFRELPKEVAEQVRKLDEETLKQLTERILTAQSLAEMGLSNGHSSNGNPVPSV